MQLSPSNNVNSRMWSQGCLLRTMDATAWRMYLPRMTVKEVSFRSTSSASSSALWQKQTDTGFISAGWSCLSPMRTIGHQGSWQKKQFTQVGKSAHVISTFSHTAKSAWHCAISAVSRKVLVATPKCILHSCHCNVGRLIHGLLLYINCPIFVCFFTMDNQMDRKSFNHFGLFRVWLLQEYRGCSYKYSRLIWTLMRPF